MINKVKQRKVEKKTCERKFYYLPAQWCLQYLRWQDAIQIEVQKI